MQICILPVGFAVALQLLLLNINNLCDEGTQINVYSSIFTNSFENVDKEGNIIDKAQYSPCVGTQNISACLHVRSMTVWETLCGEGLYTYHIQGIQHLEPGDMGRWL